MGIPSGIYGSAQKIKLGWLSPNSCSTMAGYKRFVYWLLIKKHNLSHGNVFKELTWYPPMKPTKQQEFKSKLVNPTLFHIVKISLDPRDNLFKVFKAIRVAFLQ